MRPFAYPVPGVILTPPQTARLVMETVQRFCRSADPAPSGYHVPRKLGLDTPECLAMLREALPPLAATAWDDLTSTDGQLRFDHDIYLKLWQLSGPRLPADYVLLDEAQDANPVIAAIVENQSHAQLIAVGDRCQAIYGWRGAVDAMTNFPADLRLPLAQSFRFGPAIADEANKWLSILHAGLRLRGGWKTQDTGPRSKPAMTVIDTPRWRPGPNQQPIETRRQHRLAPRFCRPRVSRPIQGDDGERAGLRFAIWI